MKLFIFCPGDVHCSILALPEPVLGPQNGPMRLSETQSISVWEKLDLRDSLYNRDMAHILQWGRPLEHPRASGKVPGAPREPRGAFGDSKMTAWEGLGLQNPPHT